MKADKNLLIPSLSGFQYGYNTSIIAGAIIFLRSTFSLTPFEEGLTVGMAMIGLCLASFSAILANSIGRKGALFLGCFFFLAGSILSSFAPNLLLLLLGRLFVGIGSGVSIVVAPIYLIETSPPEIRGSVVNLNQIGIASGSLLAYVCGYLFASIESWRWMFGLGIIPAVVQLIGLFSIPESLHKSKEGYSWKNLLAPSFASRLKLILLLTFFQALSGAAAIFFFAPIVFESVGFVGIKSSLLSTVFIGIVYFLAILVSFWIVDRMGRRFLLLSSLLGMGLCLLVTALFSALDSPWLSVVSMICILAFIAFFSLGTGPIPPMVIGEISPLQMRGHAMALMGALGWISNYVIAITFLPFLDNLGTGGTFTLYAFFCLVGFFVFLRVLPETKKKSLEEIERMF